MCYPSIRFLLPPNATEIVVSWLFSICDNIYNCVILTLVKRGCNVLLFFLYALVLPFVFVFVINIDVVFVISPIEEFKGDCGR